MQKVREEENEEEEERDPKSCYFNAQSQGMKSFC
jgi:hypothetical protein